MNENICHVRSRAPLRIGMAGGGTDLKSYYEKYEGAALNITIKKYAYAEIEKNENYVVAESIEYKKRIKLSIKEKVIYSKIPKELLLHFATIKVISEKLKLNNLIACKLSTYCDAPIGSGLGSSSTLTVAILKAFDESLNLGLDDYDIAELAFKIEREECNLAGGKQDHYSASFGGFNFIEFKKNNVLVNPLRIKEWFVSELECSFILHSLGLSRHSKDVINDQLTQCERDDKIAISNLHKIKSESYIMKNGILKCDRNIIRDSLNRSWQFKSKTSTKVSNELIDERIIKGFEFGAEAAKVSGAGGGGFILFMVKPTSAIILKNMLLEYSKETFFCNFESNGVIAWKVQ